MQCLIIEQEVLSLQEQLCAKKDFKVALEVQDEKWWLEMNDEFGVKTTWELFNLLKRAWPIERNPLNDNSATKTTKDLVRDKSTKVKKKSAKAKNKSATMKEKYKSVTVKSPTINEQARYGMHMAKLGWREEG